MNQIERVELIKAVFKRLLITAEKKRGEITITEYSDNYARGSVKGHEELVKVLKEEEKHQIDIEELGHIIGRRLSFSKRMAIGRLFNHWLKSAPIYSRYNPEMILISYLDKKGWLNTQKIMNQMTDSRIKAILGEGVGQKLIGDDKKEKG